MYLMTAQDNRWTHKNLASYKQKKLKHFNKQTNSEIFLSTICLTPFDRVLSTMPIDLSNGKVRFGLVSPPL